MALRPTRAGALAIDVELQAGVVEALRDVDVAHAGHDLDLGRELRGEVIGLVHVLRLDLDVDGRGQALVDDRVDEAAGLVVGGELGHLARQLALHAAHVLVAADAVVFLQAGLHEGRVHAGVGGVDGGEIRVDADVGDDHVHVGGADCRCG